MTSARPGLHSSSQRRGVMPLVLFWNFSGFSSWKSLNLQRGTGQNRPTTRAREGADPLPRSLGRRTHTLFFTMSE